MIKLNRSKVGTPDDSRAPPNVERELANFTTKSGLFDECITDGELDPDGQRQQVERDFRTTPSLRSKWRMPAKTRSFPKMMNSAL